MNIFARHKRVVLILILFLGLVLRFYMLGVNPPSLDWDEASLGYNAYSILKTGKDEYGNFLPLAIRSFDDYKPPLYVYLTVPTIALFGLNDAAVRMPSAILGVLTILVIYFLFAELLGVKNPKQKWEEFIFARENSVLSRTEMNPPKRNEQKEDTLGFNLGRFIPLVGAFFMAISPWSLQFSRAAFEGNIGLFFFASGLLFLLKGLRVPRWYFISAILFSLSLYSYHSFRLLVPLTILVFAIIFLKKLWLEKKWVGGFLIILAIFSIPIYTSFLTTGGGTGSRLSMVTVFGNSQELDVSTKRLVRDRETGNFIGLLFDNRRIVYVRSVAKGYFDHLSPDFLFFHGDGGRQHHAVDVGMLYWFDLPLILLGLFSLFKIMNRKITFFMLVFLLSPLPSAITTGTPHPVRAIGMLLGLIFLSSVGFVWLIREVSSITYRLLTIRVKFIVYGIIAFFFVFNFGYYLHQYYVHTPVEYGDFWQYGYKDAFSYARKNESEYDHIFVTYEYDQPYIYYLYYNKVDPGWYQKNWDTLGNGTIERFYRKIGKYEFMKINWGQVNTLRNTLVIGTKDEIPENVPTLKEIKFLNGDSAFKIVRTQ